MDVQLQADEVEALKAIYDDCFQTLDDSSSYSKPRSHSILMRSDLGQLSLELVVTFPDDYPSNSPPIHEIKNASWMSAADLQHIAEHFHTIYSDSGGDVVVYQWVEWIREFINNRSRAIADLEEQRTSPEADVDFLSTHSRQPDADALHPDLVHSLAGSSSPKLDEKDASIQSSLAVRTPCPDILHGEPLTDRKSTFQAHAATITTAAEVEVVIAELKSNKKIAAATHNIVAYRLFDSSRGVFQQDCDDDGETAAGGRLMHLLQVHSLTHKYGGIQLHADRFKHINNVARILLQESGIGLQHPEADQGSKKKRKGQKTASRSKSGRNR